MNDKRPIIKILRSSRDEFIGAYPNYPTEHEYSEESKTKASAYDNTGISVNADNQVKN